VTPEEWLAARKALLVREKAFTCQRDALSQARRDLPWEQVTKTYVFDGPNGKENLAQLFDGRSQLVVLLHAAGCVAVYVLVLFAI
jgi:predicted dithiol-disulfide oxidoreductase (DUF899 family)